MTPTVTERLETRQRARGRTPRELRAGRDRRRSLLTERLFERIDESDDPREHERLRNEVVLVNMVVARGIARRYRDRGLSFDDLEQVAYLGLTKAAERFDPQVGKDFLSFAVPTVAGEVKRYFRDCGWAVRPPRRIQELQADISRAGEALAQDLGRSARPGEVAEALGVGVEDVVEALSADGAFTPGSLDAPAYDDSDGTVGDDVIEPSADLERAEAWIVIGPAVRNLGHRDRLIIERRFVEGWTQQEIGDEIGVTQMQVSRLLSRILGELRESITA